MLFDTITRVSNLNLCPALYPQVAMCPRSEVHDWTGKGLSLRWPLENAKQFLCLAWPSADTLLSLTLYGSLAMHIFTPTVVLYLP